MDGTVKDYHTGRVCDPTDYNRTVEKYSPSIVVLDFQYHEPGSEL